MRIVIAGGPRVGKTTFAGDLGKRLGIVPRDTDSLIGKSAWSEASDVVVTWLDADGPWIVEGVAAIRAIRKWLRANPEGLPCDVLYWSDEPKVLQTAGQRAMGKACRTILEEIRGELARRGLQTKGF